MPFDDGKVGRSWDGSLGLTGETGLMCFVHVYLVCYLISNALYRHLRDTA